MESPHNSQKQKCVCAHTQREREREREARVIKFEHKTIKSHAKLF